MTDTQIGKAVKGVWWALVIRGLLALAVGILIIMRPMESVAAFALVIALWALMQGIVTTVHALELRSIASHWWVLLLNGVIGIAFGIAAFYYYPGLSIAFATVWTTWWLLLGGATGIWIAMMERGAGVPWGWTLVVGVLSVVAAGVALASPPATVAALLGLIAAFAIFNGVFLLAAAIRLRGAADAVASAMSRP
jgi:uncharacterized membrane protein HdeD (DUF308 family)